MNAAAIALLIFFTGATAHAGDEWRERDKWLFAASTALLVADWGQTRYIAKHPEKYRETNKLLGEHPSVERVDIYFASMVALNALISDALPSDWRTTWLIVLSLNQARVVVNNHSIGVRFAF